MCNERLIKVLKAINDMGFTVIELKQENPDGRAGIVGHNGQEATGTIIIRMVPEAED